MQQFWVLELLFMETCKEKPSKGKQREKVANNNSKQRCRNSTLIFFLNENNYDNTAINDKWAFLLFLASPTKLLCIFFFDSEVNEYLPKGHLKALYIIVSGF